MNPWARARCAVWVLASAAVLTGCALFQSPPLAVGQSEAEVVALLGAPTGRYAMPDGLTRVEFARGPFGRQTYMVDIGADGRSRRFDQVLNTQHLARFAEQAPGMSVDELLRTLGRPGDRRVGGWMGGETWSWRYATNDCLWFQVSIGADGRVLNGGYGIDPVCDGRDGNSRD